MTTERLFRYYPEDFREPPVRVLHMDLSFDVFDDHTVVTSLLRFRTKDKPLTSLALNAKNLEILSVGSPGYPVTYRYDREGSMLHLSFAAPVPPETAVTVETRTVCRPSRNILEGLYYDETPPGAPPQQITQCQQWGFQRIVPCIDDMTAKCTYSTTITADERYTHLISNGDVAVPRHPAGKGRAEIRYDNRTTPMAPYLFFLGCGTYAGYFRDLVYPDGRRCRLELLVPTGADPAMADRALEYLHDSILWIYLFTGPGMYEKTGLRKEIHAKAIDADRLRLSGGDPSALRALEGDLARMVKGITPGYQYTGSVYREIGMQNSDFGGMENVGNTTITTNRIMPFPGQTDPAFEYMIDVKAHEFYHNLNGSEVTGISPFSIWLNEAVTVHIENQYHAFHFGEGYTRLKNVSGIVAPVSGTLALDSGAASMPIEPDGFNDPNELITDITYVKGPEFVRMVETLIGKEVFARGLALYHSRFRHGNASRDDWIAAMEEVSGLALAGMGEGWLKQTGFPTVSVTARYDPAARSLELRLTQSGFGTGKPWVFPFSFALVDADGRDIAGICRRISSEETVITVPAPQKPAFLSLNRGHSFYGRTRYDPPADELYLQAEKDPDLVARYLAFVSVMDREKIRLLLDPAAAPDKRCTDLFCRLLSDAVLTEETGGEFLAIFDSVQDPAYAHRYQSLWEARERILARIASDHYGDLTEKYTFLWQKRGSSGDDPGDLRDKARAIKERAVKNTCLAVLARLDTPEIHRMLMDQFGHSASASDRLLAFSLLMESSYPDRDAVLASFMRESSANPVSWENFLSVIGGLSRPDAVAIVTRVESSGPFRIEQANDQRSLYGRFAMNRKRSLQTEEGRAFLKKTIIRLAAINEFSTVSLLHALDAIELMEEEYHVPLAGLLVDILRELAPGKTPSVYNTALRILKKSEKALRAYERVHGPVVLQGGA